MDHNQQRNESTQAKEVKEKNEKFLDDIRRLGVRIKGHEDELKSLMRRRDGFDKTILHLRVTLAKYFSSNGMIEYIPNKVTEKETVRQIRMHKNSAAGILCEIENKRAPYVSPQANGIVGIVARIGKMDDGNLSRLLSEYLGTKTMLALVCVNHYWAITMEAYDNEGSIRKECGIHGFGIPIRRNIAGRFDVIPLDTLRPYDGEFVADDPQKRLDLPLPRLASGDIPHGFIGFAVNMIYIDSEHLSCTSSEGHGIRDTLFYHLFSRMQIYRTRRDMRDALDCITHGAVSLDGGLIKPDGVFSYGTRENINLIFPRSSESSNQPTDYSSFMGQLKETECRKILLLEDLQRENALLAGVMEKFHLKKQEYIQFLDKHEQGRCNLS